MSLLPLITTLATFVTFVTLALPNSGLSFRLGISETDSSLLTEANVKDLLKCTTKVKSIETRPLPNKRGFAKLAAGEIDGFFPVREGSVPGLFPLSIDEVLLITRNDAATEDMSIWTVRGGLERLISKKKYKDVHQVSTPKALLKGLDTKRADAILIKRSQIPAGHSISKDYLWKTQAFISKGVALSNNFIKGLPYSQPELKKNFKGCLVTSEFPLELKRKKEIAKAFSKTAQLIKKELPRLVQFRGDRSTAEKKWSQDPKFRKTLKESEISKKIRSIFKSLPFDNEVIVFGNSGDLLGYKGNIDDFYQGDEEKFQIALNSADAFTENNVTNLYYDASTNKFQTGLVLRLTDEKGKFVGGVFIGADINKLLTHFRLI